MFEHPTQDQYGCRLQPRPAADPAIARLLDRISELEDENTELRQLEDTIRSNMHLFEALLRNSREAILLITPEMTILRLIHSVLGYSEADLLGHQIQAFIHPDDSGVLERSFSQLLAGHSRDVVCVCRVRDASGQWNSVEVCMTDMLDDTQVQAVVLNCRRI